MKQTNSNNARTSTDEKRERERKKERKRKSLVHNELLKSCILCSPFPFQHCPNMDVHFHKRSTTIHETL